jgi:hypothetical protein
VQRRLTASWTNSSGVVLLHLQASEYTSNEHAGASVIVADRWQLRSVRESLRGNRSQADLLRSKPLDQSHRPTAMGTQPGASKRWLETGFGSRWERASLQQLLAERQQCSAASVGEETARANPHKTTRQYVKQEPPQKLLGGYGHQPLLAFVSIIFPSEGDLTMGNVDNPVIGDRL